MNNMKTLELSKGASNFLKGLAILFVLLGHIEIGYNFGSYGVALFLLLSGYGLYLSYEKNGVQHFFSKRFFRVCFPYLFVTMLWITIDFFLKVPLDWKSILSSISMVYPTIDQTMWYIPFILSWYLIFYVIYRFIKNKYLQCLMLILSTFLLFVLSYRYMIYGSGGGAYLYVTFFPLGIFLAMIRNVKISQNHFQMMSILVAIIMLFLLGVTYEKYRFLYRVPNIHAMVMITVIICYFIYHKITAIKPIEWIGNISYEIYLVEGVLLLKYHSLFDWIGPGSILWKGMFLFLAIGLGYVLSLIFKKMIYQR